MKLILLVILTLISTIFGSHFRGGTISWRPLSNIPSGSTVQIQVRQRYSWRLGSVGCTDATIASGGLLVSSSTLTCYTGSCSTSGWGSGVTTNVYCTDFSVGMDLSSGERYDTFTLSLGNAISVGFYSSAWLSNLAIGGDSAWYVINRLSTILRPDGYVNSSPVVTTLPVIYKAANIQHVHVVQMSDGDYGDILKCRWSIGTTSNINSYNECGGVCSGVSGAALSTNNCTLTFTLSLLNKFYAVALQVEDYYSSSATTPMSSVPIQFLFYSYAAPSGCSIPPAIIGARPNRACIGTPIGSNVTEYVIAEVYCSGKSITDFVTSSPVGMKKTTIINLGSNLYQIILSWIPQSSQYGPQGFCAGAVDDTSVQSDQWCITFLVGFESPNLIATTSIQGTASPIGTIFANQTTFSIQATRQVNRPTRNGTYVYFNDATTGTVVYSMDCGWHPNVVYTDNTIVFFIPSPPWIPGHSYYITFDSGVASGTEFCGPESSPISDPNFWPFNIWDSARSSTTTTTTTPPTTGSITTRDLSTTSVNTALTTTGIALTTSTSNTTTFTTSTTTTESSTTITITSTTSSTTTTSIPSVDIMYPKDMENACKQPIIISNTITLGLMAIVHTLGMYAAFIKFTNIFQPNRIQLKERRKERTKKLNRLPWYITNQINLFPIDPIISIERKKNKISKQRSNKVHFKESS